MWMRGRDKRADQGGISVDHRGRSGQMMILVCKLIEKVSVDKLGEPFYQE